MHKVIAIYGNRNGCGKTTMARQIFRAALDLDHRRISPYICSFANAPKDAVNKLFGDEIDLFKYKDEPLPLLGGHTPRQILVQVCDLAKKCAGPRTFATTLIKRMDAYAEDSAPDTLVLDIIDDLRYPSERAALIEHYRDDLTLLYVDDIGERPETPANDTPRDTEPPIAAPGSPDYWYQRHTSSTVGQAYDYAARVVGYVVYDARGETPRVQ